MKIGPLFVRTLRHFFPRFNDWLDQAPDQRCQERITYPRRLLLYYGILLFVGKLGSRRQLDFQYREAGTATLDNLNGMAQTDQQTIPCNDTLDDYLAGVGVSGIAPVRTHMIGRLLDMRVLDAARVQGRLILLLDGSGYLVFRSRHCPYCLSKQHGEHTLYYHQVLEAKLLGPAETVFSMESEFIDNTTLGPAAVSSADHQGKQSKEQKVKQDCELKAAERLMPRARQAFPRLQLCLVGDALSACGRAFQLAKDHKASFMAVFKPGSIPTLWTEFQSLLELSRENRLEVTTADGWRHVYRWVKELPYIDTEKRQWQLQAIGYSGIGPKGETSEWAWLLSSDWVVNAATVEELVWEVGRARWRIENQGFNMQKTSELNLEHAYSEKSHFGVYYVLLQIAHLLLQLLEKGNLLKALAKESGKRTAVDLFGSLKNIAAFFVESLRNALWPQEVFGPAGRIQIRLDNSS